MRRTIIAVVMVCLTAACGGNGPTGPSSSIPNVVGTYSGNVTITFPELTAQVNCPSSTSVTQSGATVSIAPLVLRGECGSQSIPLGQVEIDATGSIGSESGTFNDPSCGNYTYSASGGFFGRELRLSMTATSPTCYNFNFTATLTK